MQSWSGPTSTAIPVSRHRAELRWGWVSIAPMRYTRCNLCGDGRVAEGTWRGSGLVWRVELGFFGRFSDALTALHFFQARSSPLVDRIRPPIPHAHAMSGKISFEAMLHKFVEANGIRQNRVAYMQQQIQLFHVRTSQQNVVAREPPPPSPCPLLRFRRRYG